MTHTVDRDSLAGDVCEFGPPHEPFGCLVHHGIRTRLTDIRCNRAYRRDPGVDWTAIEHLIDAAIRRGTITESRGAEILGLRLFSWRERAVEIHAEGNPLAALPETPSLDVERPPTRRDLAEEGTPE